MRNLILATTIVGTLLIGILYRTNISEGVVAMPNNNPLLTTQELPTFHAIKPEHFAPAVEYVLNNFNTVLLDKVLTEQHPSWNNTVLPLEG